MLAQRIRQDSWDEKNARLGSVFRDLCAAFSRQHSAPKDPGEKPPIL